MLQGNKILFHGALMFERLEKDAKAAKQVGVVSKMLVVEGSYCLSMAELDNKALDLGRIGYETAWREVPFELQVKNLSEVQFLGRLPALPPEIAFTNTINVLRIPPFKQRTIKGVLLPRKVRSTLRSPRLTSAVDPQSPGGPVSVQHHHRERQQPGQYAAVAAQRTHDALPPKVRLLPACITAQRTHTQHIALTLPLTPLPARFGHLDFVNGSPQLAFAPLKHVPSATPESVDEWFAVENTSIKPVTVTLEPQLDAARDFISALVYPRSAMAPVSSFSLNPGEALELRVRLTAKPDARLPKPFSTRHTHKQTHTLHT